MNIKTIWHIPAMDCPVEEAEIRKKLETLPGIEKLEFNLVSRRLKVTHDPEVLRQISNSLESLDMGARVETDEPDKPDEPVPWKKLAWAGAAAMFSEIFEFMSDGGATSLAHMEFAGMTALSWLSLLMAILAIVLSGMDMYKKGFKALSRFDFNMNTLMFVAVTGAVLIGQYPEAAAVIVLFNISEAIEARSVERARKAIGNLMALAPETITIRDENGKWREVNVSDAHPGFIARVRPGEKIGLDGIVLSGTSTVNQAPITGESLPVEKKQGDQVYAGTINETGSFEYRITSGATNSTLARIISAVEDARATRAPIQRFVDIFARYYTPCVFVFAILVALGLPPVFGLPWHEGVYEALVILVTGCPCALVISSSVTIVSGLAAATRAGILVKGGIYLETGRLLKALAMDKTGTITRGHPVQTDFAACGGLEPQMARLMAFSLASRSDHPVSSAIAENGAKEGLEALDVENFEAVPGMGITGLIKGRTVVLGNIRLVRHLGIAENGSASEVSKFENQGKTAVLLAVDGKVEAVFAVADAIKPGSIEAIKELRALGVHTVMLTGDNMQTAAAIASQAGVDEFRAGQLPGDKLKVIDELELSRGWTGMAGDGINDAPALARANIGFAMAMEGTDTAIETADVALMDDDLRKIPRFMRISRGTMTIMMENIIFALAIKFIFFALALTGNATMWMAVFADVGTSLIVVSNSLRALKK